MTIKNKENYYYKSHKLSKKIVIISVLFLFIRRLKEEFFVSIY